jgi:hypothetical protein
MDTQTQIDRLIELAIVQRSELKSLVEQLPQLREYLGSEIEKTFEVVEPQLRTELEEFCNKKTEEYVEGLRGEVSAQVSEILKTLEYAAAAKYSALMTERARNAELEKQAEAKIAEAAAAMPDQVKEIVTAELAKFPRAGEINQLRKEFAEPRGLNPRGKWQPGETYNKLDLVSFNGDSFVSSIDGNTEKPNRSGGNWTLNAARGASGGGGGITSLTDLYNRPQNGELLIGNGTDYQNSTLTAGDGITITNAAGAITIDASVAQGYLNLQAKNGEATAITRGQVVYVSGASGSIPQVKLAVNTADPTSQTTIGVVADTSIASGDTGTIRCVGEVKNVNTGSFTAGNILYLDSTPGQLTNVKPVAPNHLVQVGLCEKVNAVSGEIYVFVQNGYELDELHNVLITSVANGQTLVYDSATSLWKNSTTINGTAIPASKTLVVTTDKLSALAATTSAELAGVISDETGSGKLVFATSPTLTTPVLGAASATSLNLSGLTASSAVATDASKNLVSVTNTGTGNNVLATSPTLTTPVLGAATGTSITGPTTTDLTLQGGSTGASLLLGQGTSSNATFTLPGSGQVVVNTAATYNDFVVQGTAGTATIAVAKTGGQFSRLQVGTAGSGIIYGSGGPFSFQTAGTITGATTEIARFSVTNNNLLIGGTTDISGTGGLKVFGTTDASSTTSGAFQVAGGIGVTKKSYFGDAMTINHATDSYLMLQIAGSNAGFFEALGTKINLTAYNANGFDFYAGGTNPGNKVTSLTSSALSVLPTTASTSTTSGALQVAGGVGVAGKLYIGSTLDMAGAISGANSITSAASTSLVLTGNSGTSLTLPSNAGGGGVATLNHGLYASYSYDGDTAGIRMTNASTGTSAAGALQVANDSGTLGGLYLFSSLHGVTALRNKTSLVASGSIRVFTNSGSSSGQAGTFVVAPGGYNDADVLTVSRTATTSAKPLSVTDTTEATTGGAGALTVSGGIYATKKVITASTLTTAAPTSGTAKEWKLGEVASVSPTSPNRTIRVEIDGTVYFISAKTTND